MYRYAQDMHGGKIMSQVAYNVYYTVREDGGTSDMLRRG